MSTNSIALSSLLRSYGLKTEKVVTSDRLALPYDACREESGTLSPGESRTLQFDHSLDLLMINSILPLGLMMHPPSGPDVALAMGGLTVLTNQVAASITLSNSGTLATVYGVYAYWTKP